MNMDKKVYISDQLISAIKTIFIFCCFCFCIPFIVLSYTCVSVSRLLFMTYLSSRYSNLEFAKTNNLLSFIETPRNPGVFHALITVEGTYNIDVIKSNLEENLLNRKHKFERTSFRRLKSTLISCWGYYAWIQKDFNINNHVHVHSSLFRGRPITDQNIQDCVSYIISKYMPTEIPPWQITVIPGGQDQSENYYILVRMHHLILDEEPNLHISDILMLNVRKSQTLNKCIEKSSQSPFQKLMFQPKYIPKLYSRITVSISNRWNEFIYKHDPLESPDCSDKHHASSIFELFSVYLIMIVAVVHDFYKDFHATRNTPQIKFKFFCNLIKREMKRRHLNWETVKVAFCNTINPLNIIKSVVILIWSIGITCTLMWPFFLYKEFMAIKCCVFMNHYGYPNTIVGFIFEYTPLIYHSIQEMVTICNIIITAPRYIFEELFGKNNRLKHSLQKVSLCGRKVVSWSESINKNDLKEISTSTGYSESEILLSMTSHALRDFLITTEKSTIPDSIDTIVRSVHHDYLFGQLNFTDSMEGFGCLQLPVDPLSFSQLKRMRNTIKSLTERQVALNLLISAVFKFDRIVDIFPVLWIRILLNYLSKRFTVTITEVTEPTTELEYYTIWNQCVKSVIYFQSPQSNISLSLTLQRFGSTIKLGVMTDAEIHANYTSLSNNWPKYIENFCSEQKI